jgi:hypothetical protein
VTALPLMAWHLDPEWRTIPGLDRIKRAFAQEQDARYRGVPSALFAAEMIALGAVGGTVGGTEIVADHFDPKVFPVAAVEQARRDHLTGRIYAEFIWGGYLLYAWPEQRVFIDGGTDYYGEQVFTEYLQVWNLDPPWNRVLEKYRITLTLVPPQSRLAHELIRDRQWSLWYCDSTAAILRPPAAANQGGSMSASPADSVLARCGAGSVGPR